jgi:hypothetical protein
MATFFDEFNEETVAVMIHSKDGIDVDAYRGYVRRLWSECAT